MSGIWAIKKNFFTGNHRVCLYPFFVFPEIGSGEKSPVIRSVILKKMPRGRPLKKKRSLPCASPATAGSGGACDAPLWHLLKMSRVLPGRNHCNVINRPPCANPAPVGGSIAHVMPGNPFKIDPLIRRYRNPGMPQRRGGAPRASGIYMISTEHFFLKTGNTAPSQPVPPGGGAKIRERQVSKWFPLYCRKPIFWKFIAPLAPALPVGGSIAHAMPREISVQKISYAIIYR